MRAVITIVGKDRVGIIAAVTGLLAKENVNILDITQTILSGYFTMVMMVDLAGMNVSYAEMIAALNELGEKLGLEIRMQRSEIFDAMHRL